MRSNPFESHGIDHLSVSSLSLFAAAPGIWVMERLLGREAPVGAAAHRGTAVEAGVIAALKGATPAEAVNIANATFAELTAFSTDPRRDKERAALADMVEQGIRLLTPWGIPDRIQCGKTWRIDGVAVPVIGFSDAEFDRHGLIVDLKTSFALPNKVKAKHARQVASYVGRSNANAAVAYVTNRKAAIYLVEDVSGHIAALSRQALSLQRFLALSGDPWELAALLSVDTDSYFLADPRARQAAWEVFGV
jgi:PD-(D/E)XK nuclease superfamily protein